MQSWFPHLPVMIVVSPLIGAVLTLVLAPSRAQLARKMAIVNAGLTAGLVVTLAIAFNPRNVDRQGLSVISFRDAIPWLGTPRSTGHLPQSDSPAMSPRETPSSEINRPADNPPAATMVIHGLDVRMAFGADGLSIWPLLCVTCLVTASWWGVADPDETTPGIAGRLAWQGCCAGVFLAQDLLLMVACLELSVLTSYGLTGQPTGARRQQPVDRYLLGQRAAHALILLASLGLVLARSWLDVETPDDRSVLQFQIPELLRDIRRLVTHSELAARSWEHAATPLFSLLAAGWLLKFPLYPLHGPAVEMAVNGPARRGGLLVAVQLMMAGYGWSRFVPALFLGELQTVSSGIMTWGAVAAGLCGWLALAQSDPRKLVVLLWYAQVACGVVGCATGTTVGLLGAWLLWSAAGCGSVATLALLTAMEDRFQTRDVEAFGGLLRGYPLLATLLGVGILGLVAVPGTGCSAGHLLILQALIREWSIWVAWYFPGVLLSSWAAIWMIQRLLTGPFREPVAGDSRSETAPAGFGSGFGSIFSATFTYSSSGGGAEYRSYSTAEGVDSPGMMAGSSSFSRQPDLAFREIISSAAGLMILVALMVTPAVAVRFLRPTFEAEVQTAATGSIIAPADLIQRTAATAIGLPPARETP